MSGFNKKIIFGTGGTSAPSEIIYAATLNGADTDVVIVPTDEVSAGGLAGRTFERTDVGKYLVTCIGAFADDERVRTSMPVGIVGNEFQSDARVINDDTAEIGIYDFGGNRVDGFSQLVFTIES